MQSGGFDRTISNAVRGVDASGFTPPLRVVRIQKFVEKTQDDYVLIIVSPRVDRESEALPPVRVRFDPKFIGNPGEKQFMDYTIIWTYCVDPERRAEFEAAYGSKGAWATLFERADGFLGVEFLRCAEDDGRYVTIDRWASQRAFESFNARFATEYRSLDDRLEGIAATEERIGVFAAVAAA